MKFSLTWLKDHLETDATLQDVVEKLTAIGHEVEGVEDPAEKLAGFTVAKVLTAEKHPDADKLQVLTVDTGTGDPLQVVCGAPNARAGMKGVLGQPGAVVPSNGMELRKSAIRGVESNGMMCSVRELELGEDHDGIIELPEDAQVGHSFAEYHGSSPVIDVAITPNRPDCMGVYGIARDLAAAGLGTLKPIAMPGFEAAGACPVEIRTDDPEGCPAFYGRVIKGVTNGPSPDWLQQRLTSAGQRPISLLVDLTNYLMLAFGRPAHVYDLAKLHGAVVARRAKAGEQVLALNEKTYTLDDSMVVIADDNEVHDIAGIMGGENSGVQDDTTDVLLEIAYFDPTRIGVTGRKLGIATDARTRFERGVDEAAVVDMTEMASRLIIDLCGGEASELVVAGEEPQWQRTITLRKARVKQLTGVDVPESEMVRILDVLGCDLKDTGDAFDVQPPSWHSDIELEACLVEEVIRVYGYDHIEEVSLERETNLPKVALTPAQQKRDAARRTLVARGVSEAVTYAFLPEKQAKLFGWSDEDLRLTNPISTDLEIMRPSLLPNLLAACQRNNDRGMPNGCLFEVGPQFDGDEADKQPVVVGGVRTGQTGPRNWAEGPRRVDVFDAKADVIAILEAAGAKVDS